MLPVVVTNQGKYYIIKKIYIYYILISIYIFWIHFKIGYNIIHIILYYYILLKNSSKIDNTMHNIIN